MNFRRALGKIGARIDTWFGTCSMPASPEVTYSFLGDAMPAPETQHVEPAVVPRRRRKWPTCYYPGCKNKASPRNQMFCVDVHGDLSLAMKANIREARHAREAKK